MTEKICEALNNTCLAEINWYSCGDIDENCLSTPLFRNCTLENLGLSLVANNNISLNGADKQARIRAPWRKKEKHWRDSLFDRLYPIHRLSRTLYS